MLIFTHTPATTNTTPTVEQTTPVPPVAVTYKDGSYTESGTYNSPAGQESVSVSITLKDNIVTAAGFTGSASNPRSVVNQQKFQDGYTQLVVGKNINDISLTVVNGSSLTSRGFMDALAKIKNDAKA